MVIRRYFQEVLVSPRLPVDCNEIQLHADGNWSANAPAKSAPLQQQQTANDSVTLIADDLGTAQLDIML